MAGVLLTTSLWGSNTMTAQAASRMYGVQAVVNQIGAGTPFTIVELVSEELTSVLGDEKSTAMFAENVLGLDSTEYIEVLTLTPAEFEARLAKGETQDTNGALTWNAIGMLYISEGANDLTWDGVKQIYEQATDKNLPVLVEQSLVSLDESATGFDTNVQKLALLLRAYDATSGSVYKLGGTAEESAELISDAVLTAEEQGKGTNPSVAGSVYFDDDFTNMTSTVTDVTGLEAVKSEIASENYYSEINGQEEIASTDNLTQANILQYIINYANRRTVEQKETIRVLDIEPTRFSLLTEDKIREWLGENGSEDVLKEVEIVQTTTYEFIGKTMDLVNEFDMIYIGSYDGPTTGGQIGPITYDFAGILNVDDKGNTVYNDTTLNGLIYSDVGDTAKVTFETKDTEPRYSGNDITTLKLQELREYVSCGYPIVVSKDLYVANTNTISAKKVKSSSNMYKLLSGSTGKKAVDNVIKEESAESSLLKTLINIPKLELTLIESPTEYKVTYTDNSETEIKEIASLPVDDTTGNSQLQFKFEFSDNGRNLSEDYSYKVELFMDENGDGQFSAYEELTDLTLKTTSGKSVKVNKIKPNTRYTLLKEFSSDYQGAVNWMLKVTVVDAKGAELSARSSVTGQSFASDNDPKTMIKINALQLTAGVDGLKPNSNGTVQLLLKNLGYDAETGEGLGLYDVNIDTDKQSQYISDCAKALSGQTSTGKTMTVEEFYESYFKDYDMLIIGFADNYSDTVISGFTNTEIYSAVRALEMYIESGRSVVFSHDTTSYKCTASENYWGYCMNRLIREYAGMDRYDVLDTKTGDTIKGTMGYTNMLLDANTTSTYQSLDYNGENANDPTTLISQVNKGQITSFPYDVNVMDESDSIEFTYEGMTRKIMSPGTAEIKETHAQYYQLDLDDTDIDGDGKSDLIVWYSLAGEFQSNSIIPGIMSELSESAYSAMVNDVRNNYYIYSLGNVTYTSMGYSNDMSVYEAKLFVNTLIAADSLGIKTPTVNILDLTDDEKSNIEDVEETIKKENIIGENAYGLDEVYRAFDEEAGIYLENDETLYFHVKDANNLTAVDSKSVLIRYYYQIDPDSNRNYSYASLREMTETELNKMGIRKWTEDGKTIYLKSFGVTEFEDGDLQGDITNNIYSANFKYTTGVGVTEISAATINDVLTNQESMDIYIFVQMKLNYTYKVVDSDGNETTATRTVSTEEGVDHVTIKKMPLFNLD